MSNTELNRVSEWMRKIMIVSFLRWRLIVIACLAAMAVTLVLTFVLPPLYNGSFSVIMRGNEQDSAMLQTGDSYVTRGMVADTMTTNEERILNSPELASRVIEKIKTKYPDPSFGWISLPLPDLSAFKASIKSWIYKLFGLTESPSPLSDPLVEELRKALVITPMIGTNVIEISIMNPDPDFTFFLLNTYLNTYMELRQDLWMASGAPGFFNQEAGNYLGKWKEINDRLYALKQSVGVVVPTQELQQLQERVGDLRTQINLVDLEIADLEQSMTQAKGMKSTEFIPVGSLQDAQDKALEELQVRLGQSLSLRAEALKNFTAQSPEVKRIDREINELNAQSRKVLLVRLENMLSVKKHNRMQLLEKIDSMTQQLFVVDKARSDMAILEEEADIARTNMKAYENKRAETSISIELRKATFSNVGVMSPPYIPAKPFFPKRVILLALALAVGLFIGMTIAVLLEMLDDSFKLPEEITTVTGLPVLASFPYTKPDKPLADTKTE